MNEFFKHDIRQIKIPVQGETDEYTVTIRLEGVLEEIARHIKQHNNQFEFKTVLQSITKTEQEDFKNEVKLHSHRNADHFGIRRRRNPHLANPIGSR